MAVNQVVVKLGADITDLQAKLRDAASAIDKAVKGSLAKTGADLQKIGDNMTGVGRSMTNSITLPIVGATAAIVAAGSRVADLAEKLDNMRQSTGLTTDQLQVLKYTAENAGISFDTVAKASVMIQQKLMGVEEDTGMAADALRKLGVETKDAAGQLRPMSEMFPEILKRLQGMTNQTERNMIASQLFGRSWAELAPIMGMSAEEFAKAEEEARKLGVVMGEDALKNALKFDETMDRLKQQLQGLAISAGNAAIKIINGFVAMPKPLQVVVATFGGLLIAIGPVTQAIGMLTKGIGGAIKIFVAADAWIRSMSAAKVADTAATAANTAGTAANSAAQAANTAQVGANTVAVNANRTAVGGLAASARAIGPMILATLALAAAWKAVGDAMATTRGDYDRYLAESSGKGFWSDAWQQTKIFFGAGKTNAEYTDNFARGDIDFNDSASIGRERDRTERMLKALRIQEIQLEEAAKTDAMAARELNLHKLKIRDAMDWSGKLSQLMTDQGVTPTMPGMPDMAAPSIPDLPGIASLGAAAVAQPITIYVEGDAAKLMAWTAKTANGEAVKVVNTMARELLVGA